MDLLAEFRARRKTADPYKPAPTCTNQPNQPGRQKEDGQAGELERTDQTEPEASKKDRIPGRAILRIWQDTRTATPQHDYTRCPCCGGGRWWISIHGARVCAKCHPPATPELVARWEGEQDEH